MSRARERDPEASRIDLLKSSWVRRLVTSPWFPYSFQVAALAGLAGLAVLARGVHAPAGLDGRLFAKANLATLAVWGIWWPSMIWVAVLLGRAWCMVCPLELVANVAERVGRALGLSRRPLPRWLAGGGAIVALYAAIQLLVAGAHIHRVPAYTAFFLVGLLGLALLVGLLFENRAFCRGFCPVGKLLAV